MDQLFIILPGILGGVGLFLVGMILMSEGLKSAAGSGLQRILEKVTGTPLAAFFSGAGLTALVQSSSATTITTIGFVSAGLLTFPAALGVIVGANVGTTSTGWIVSLLGFKLNVGTIALPFIGVGALMKLLSSGRRAHFGMAIVGFGLIFVGIDFLQEGMGGLALLHAGDHASRLIEACLESEEPLAGTEAIAAAAQLAPTLAIAVEWLNNQEGKGNKVTRHLKKASKAQAKLRRDQRAKLLEQTAAGLVQPDEAQRYLESMRWVDRIGYHSWRMLYHLVDPLTADVALAAEAYSESDLAAEDP